MNMRALPDGFQPLPPYADPRAILVEELSGLRAAEKVSVTEAAEGAMRVNVAGQWKPYRRHVAPYLAEPADTLASRNFQGMALAGPSQCGKTLVLQMGISYCVRSDPSRVALIHTTRNKVAEFEMEKLAPMIRNSPELQRRQAKGRGADTQYQKLFRGGTHLTLGWPTVEQLSSSTIRFVLGTDIDRFGASIEGEGSFYSLAKNRPRSYRSRGMVGCESSPGADITDETWVPSTIHEAPPVAYGILRLYNEGTRARWYVDCLDCGEPFELHRRYLKWDEPTNPAAAAASVELRCPHCGSVHKPAQKPDLNATGRWLHESACGKRAVPLGDPEIRKAAIASYWLNGAAAAFATWGELVAAQVEAQNALKATGDEEPLVANNNTDWGEPHYRQSAAPENELALKPLKEKAQKLGTPRGVAPAWTRYVVVTVDTQATYFAATATAFGENGRHQVIDRIDLAAAPDGTERKLDPFNRAGDWDVLEALETRAWPVDGADYALRPVALTVDMQGGFSTTENAYGFYRKRRRAGVARWYLTRGSGGTHTDRVWLKAPEATSRPKRGRKRRVAKDIEILNIATDRIKDAVATSLRLDEGENICLFPAWMAEDDNQHLLIEYTAERRMTKGWEKRPGMQRNEMFDLLVQVRAVNIVIGGERVNWAKPPDWCGPCERNPHVNWLTAEIPAAVETAKAARARPRRVGYLNRG